MTTSALPDRMLPSSPATAFASPGPLISRAAAHVRRRHRKRMEAEAPPPSKVVLRTVDVVIAGVVGSVSVAAVWVALEAWQLVVGVLAVFGVSMADLF